jgi:hypothetical protein
MSPHAHTRILQRSRRIRQLEIERILPLKYERDPDVKRISLRLLLTDPVVEVIHLHDGITILFGK